MKLLKFFKSKSSMTDVILVSKFENPKNRTVFDTIDKTLNPIGDDYPNPIF